MKNRNPKSTATRKMLYADTSTGNVAVDAGDRLACWKICDPSTRLSEIYSGRELPVIKSWKVIIEVTMVNATQNRVFMKDFVAVVIAENGAALTSSHTSTRILETLLDTAIDKDFTTKLLGELPWKEVAEGVLAGPVYSFPVVGRKTVDITKVMRDYTNKYILRPDVTAPPQVWLVAIETRSEDQAAIATIQTNPTHVVEYTTQAPRFQP